MKVYVCIRGRYVCIRGRWSDQQIVEIHSSKGGCRAWIEAVCTSGERQEFGIWVAEQIGNFYFDDGSIEECELIDDLPKGLPEVIP